MLLARVTLYFQQVIFTRKWRIVFIYCFFDDLGVEQFLKYYANEDNDMNEILLSRYNFFISKIFTPTPSPISMLRN